MANKLQKGFITFIISHIHHTKAFVMQGVKLEHHGVAHTLFPYNSGYKNSVFKSKSIKYKLVDSSSSLSFYKQAEQ